MFFLEPFGKFESREQWLILDSYSFLSDLYRYGKDYLSSGRGKSSLSKYAKVRLSIAAKRKLKCHKTQETSTNALIHRKHIISRTLLDMVCSLAHTRLLGIISHRQQKIREQATACTIRGTKSATYEALGSHRSISIERKKERNRLQ